MKRLILKIALYLLNSSFQVDYKKIDKKALEEWAYRSFDDKGWRSYFAYEDLKLLKNIAQGLSERDYWMNIGRRLQLLYIFDEMRKAVENKKTREEKKAKVEVNN